MVGVGGIVSVGGAGGSGGGSTSGIQSINGATGPAITFAQSGIINILRFGNTISIGAQQSGVIGVNGIQVQQVGGNFVIDGAGASGAGGSSSAAVGVQFSAPFTSITSGCFNHSLGSRDVVVQVRDDSLPPRLIIPDAIIYDTLDKVSVLFNRPQTGRITIIGSGVSCITSSEQVVEARRYALLVC